MYKLKSSLNLRLLTQFSTEFLMKVILTGNSNDKRYIKGWCHDQNLLSLRLTYKNEIKTLKIKIVPVDSHACVSLSQCNSGCWITGCSGEYFEVKKITQCGELWFTLFTKYCRVIKLRIMGSACKMHRLWETAYQLLVRKLKRNREFWRPSQR